MIKIKQFIRTCERQNGRLKESRRNETSEAQNDSQKGHANRWAKGGGEEGGREGSAGIDSTERGTKSQ